MSNKSIGEIISSLRKEKGMTQNDLAEKMNVTDKAVSKWERNLSCPDVNSIPKLAEILGTTVEELLNAQPKKENNKTKEEKQQFISKYIDNIVIDKTDKGSLDIKQINFRSSFIDKAVKLTQVGAYDYKLPFEVNHKQEMVLVSSPMKRKQVNKYLGCLREYFEIEYREDKGDRTENGMTVFDSAIPDNYELLKVIPIIDLNLFKGKDITFGLVFRPTIKEIINEK
jgi:transcriptional regulator with XRE-family HTH domain